MNTSVDVLAVMRRCANVSTCNAQRHGGPTLKKHADEVSEACAAVAELIEAVEPFAVLADQLDATEYRDAEDDDEWAKFRMVVKDYRKIRSALARAKGI